MKNFLAVLLVLVGGIIVGFYFFQPWVKFGLRLAFNLKMMTYSGFKLASKESALVYILPALSLLTILFVLIYRKYLRSLFRILAIISAGLSVAFVIVLFINLDNQLGSWLGKVINLKFLTGIFAVLGGSILQLFGSLIGSS